MKVTFQDFYGQFVEVNNNTASGNIRIKVNTMENMNDLRGKAIEDCTIETNISLSEAHLKILMGALCAMEE